MCFQAPMGMYFLPLPKEIRMFMLLSFTNPHTPMYCELFFLAVLGFCRCMWAISSCGELGLLFVAVRGLLIAVASLVAEHGLQYSLLTGCRVQAQ